MYVCMYNICCNIYTKREPSVRGLRKEPSLRHQNKRHIIFLLKTKYTPAHIIITQLNSKFSNTY